MRSDRARPILLLATLILAACGGEPDPGAPGPAATSTPAPLAVAAEYLLVDPPRVPPLPLQIRRVPGGGGFFILGRDGHLAHYDRALESFPAGSDGLAAGARAFPGRITSVHIEGGYAHGDLGTLGVVLDPDFAANRFLYVWYADKKDENVLLDRFQWTGDPASILASRTNVITISRRSPPHPYHMGGILEFLPDKTLLIAVGDAERPELSQDPTDLNGKLLRIRPRRSPEGGYDVPDDNPRGTDPRLRPEIAAVGLRAPFRGFLHGGKDLWFGDVGAVHEEVNVWRGGFADFGWGRSATSDGPLGTSPCVDPLVHWSLKRDFAVDDPDYNGETRLSAAAGPIYEARGGDRYAGRLTGRLIFYDIMRGWIRAGAVTAGATLGSHEHIGHRQFIGELIEGDDGFIYGVTWVGPQGLFRFREAGELRSPAPTADPGGDAGGTRAR